MAITYAMKPNQDIEKAPVTYYLLSSDTKPTAASHVGLPAPSVGSLCYETNTLLWYVTYDGTNWVSLKNAGEAGLATKTSGGPAHTHLATGTLFNWYGSVEIQTIIGRVTVATEAATNTCKLSMVADALTAVDLCATKDLNNLAVGTLLHIDGTLANAMIAATGVGVSVAQAGKLMGTCITSGTITVTYGTAAKDGEIVWEVRYVPLSVGGRIVAA
jgi:hypothetical protein